MPYPGASINTTTLGCKEMGTSVFVLIFHLQFILSDAFIKRQSSFDSMLQFTFPWECRDPTAAEGAAMIANGNPSFEISTSFDPIGTSGGCMPDATCINGSSQWTNVFGLISI